MHWRISRQRTTTTSTPTWEVAEDADYVAEPRTTIRPRTSNDTTCPACTPELRDHLETRSYTQRHTQRCHIVNKVRFNWHIDTRCPAYASCLLSARQRSSNVKRLPDDGSRLYAKTTRTTSNYPCPVLCRTLRVKPSDVNRRVHHTMRHGHGLGQRLKGYLCIFSGA